MDFINYAIDTAKNTIPREILMLAYVGKPKYRQAPVSLDEQIRRQTIVGRVLRDMSLVGGEDIVVDLTGLKPEQIDRYNYKFTIPAERLNYRQILTALSVSYMNYSSVMNNYMPGTSANTPNYINDVSSAAQRAMDSRGNIPIVSNAEVYAIDHRTILIRNHMLTAQVAQVRLTVTDSENLENLSVRSAPDFADLCIWAIKSFIFNKLHIALDRGMLEAGQELGVVKNYVDELRDAEENYRTFLKEQWGAVAFINNRLAYEKFLKLSISPGL